MPVKVSVVVPVYNPGRYIDDCIASLIGQSLPKDEYEAIFVDDGSTDDTPARLDAVAAAQPNVRVIHQENSGWPGKPRNVGIDAARGEYVYFVDNDDSLAPEALERLYKMASANGADVALGKESSNFRGVSLAVFRRNRQACTLADAPLIDSLTPHKMFRRKFLIDRAIRFPEGKRRLEDQLFVVRAYVAARVVSVLADYVCYFYARRSDGSNAGSGRIEPAGYYANVREVIGVVLENVPPGDLRDRLMRRFCRAEMLSRVSEPSFNKRDPQLKQAIFTSVRDIVRETITPGVEEGLGVIPRLRLRLLRENRMAELAALAERLDTVTAVAELTDLRWDEGRLELSFRAGFRVAGDSARNLVVDDGERCLIDPGITDGITTPIDVTESIGSIRVDTVIRIPETGDEWLATTRSTVRRATTTGQPPPSGLPAVDAIASIDPARVAGKRPLPRGTWDVLIRVSWLGFERRTLLHGAAESAALVRPAILADTTVVPYVGDDRALRLDVDGATRTLASALDPNGVSASPSDGRTIRVHLPIASTEETRRRAVAVVVGGARDSRDQHITGDLTPARGGMVLTATVRRAGVPAGRHPLGVRLDGLHGPVVPIGAAIAVAAPDARDGRIYVEGSRRIGPVEAAVRLAGIQTAAPARRVAAIPTRAVRAAAHWERARRVVEWMPAPVQRGVRRLYGVVRRRGLRTP